MDPTPHPTTHPPPHPTPRASQPPADPASEARCVLLVGADAAPAGLTEILKQRRIAVTLVRSAPQVMAELAGGGVPWVVVVEPERQDRAQELRTAAHVYHPSVRFWRYDRQAPGQEAALRTFAPTPEPAGENTGTPANRCYPSAYGQEKAATPPAPGFNGPVSPNDRHAAAAHATQADPDPVRVTEQELAMLLDTEPPPAPRTGPEADIDSVFGRRGPGSAE